MPPPTPGSRTWIDSKLVYVDIKSVEEMPTTLYLVIPPKAPKALSDAQLEQVVGGTVPNTGYTYGGNSG
jgi:hypothetical protein